MPAHEKNNLFNLRKSFRKLIYVKITPYRGWLYNRHTPATTRSFFEYSRRDNGQVPCALRIGKMIEIIPLRLFWARFSPVSVPKLTDYTYT